MQSPSRIASPCAIAGTGEEVRRGDRRSAVVAELPQRAVYRIETLLDALVVTGAVTVNGITYDIASTVGSRLLMGGVGSLEWAIPYWYMDANCHWTEPVADKTYAAMPRRY